MAGEFLATEYFLAVVICYIQCICGFLFSSFFSEITSSRSPEQRSSSPGRGWGEVLWGPSIDRRVVEEACPKREDQQLETKAFLILNFNLPVPLLPLSSLLNELQARVVAFEVGDL